MDIHLLIIIIKMENLFKTSNSKIAFYMLEYLTWNKNIYVYKMSNINPLMEKHNSIYSIIDLC
jgi:hypothetical protein